MGLYCSILLTGEVGPVIRSIMAMAAPWAGIHATDGDYFPCWGRSEWLIVEWVFVLDSISSSG